MKRISLFLASVCLVVLPVFSIDLPEGVSVEKLTGTPCGSPNVDYSTGASSETVNTPACAFDGNPSTFYASLDRSRTWVGLDLGTAHVITRVGWCPRSGQLKRVCLGLFEGSNREDFMDAVPLYLIPESSTEQSFSYADVNVSRGFRYVRYVGPNDCRCNIADLEFYGYESEGSDSTFYQVTNLPTVSIHTLCGYDPQDKVTDLDANLTITYDNGTRIQEYPILTRGRGNASWNFPKKPCRIKFNDGEAHHMLKGSPQESPAKAKKWTLINNYGDKTLMRNILAFECSRRLGAEYTPYCQPVDVIMNGEYKGCYQLCDQITVSKNRVDITEMEPTDIAEPELTGGYLVEVDAYASQETSWFTSSHNIPVKISSPSDDDITTEQSKYIKDYWNLFEGAAFGASYTDEQNGYRKYLDVESFLRHFLVGEFSGNTDTYWSVYMHKDREEGQFHVSPSWDFDLAFNNDSRIYPVCNRDDWVFRSGGSGAGNMSSLVSRILSDSYADKRLKEIWRQMRVSGAFSEDSLVAFVDSIANVLEASQQLNFTRWPILSQKVHQNAFALGSYAEEVNVLRDYIPERLAWIDEYLGVSSDDDGRIYTDSVFYIGTPEQLIEFATTVNKGGNRSEGYLTADIDMEGYSDQFTPIGNGSHPFIGTFNGNGHRISNLHINGFNNTGFFGSVSGGATISDFIFDSSCSIVGNSYLGVVGVSSGTGLVSVSRVGNEAPVTGEGVNAAGIIGCNYGSDSQFVITDCYNTGTIIGGSESATICGWAGNNGIITNCWNTADVTGYNKGNDFSRGSVSFTNCYSIFGTQVSSLNTDMVGSGELCYRLNGSNQLSPVWYQLIGTDEHPVYSYKHGKVYKADDGTYYNSSLLVGDVNADNVVDAADAAMEADYLMGDAADGFQQSNADVTGDGEIDVFDLVGLINTANGVVSSFCEETEKTARFYSSNASVKASGGRKVTVWLSAEESLSAYQADIVLSDGLQIDTATIKSGALSSSSHILRKNVKDNAVSLLVYSPQGAAFTGQTGTALTFTLRGDETFNGGTFELKNIKLCTATGTEYLPADASYTVSLAKTYVTGIELGMEELAMMVGDQTEIPYTILPATATVKTLKWTSADESVAKVSGGGVVSALSVGTTTVSAAATDGSNIKTTIPVTVDDADGILSLHADLSHLRIYTLTGMKVGKITQRGIYIVNGKKTLIK